MSDKKTADHDKNTDSQATALEEETEQQPLPRRRFLGSLLAGTAAGGALMAYQPPTAHAATSSDPLCGEGDVPWDVDHFDDQAVLEAAEIMASYPYSPEAAQNVEALTPVAQRWIENGARGLDDEELAQVFRLGWRPTAELNADDAARAQVNAALRFNDKVWAPKPGNWGEYESPLPSASRARLARFEAGVEVQAMSAILVGILIVILVVDFPTPAE